MSKRLCTMEDELHFLVNYKSYEPERQRLFLMINEKKQNLQRLNDVKKFTFLLSTRDNQLIVWIGKFIYTCFLARYEFVLKQKRHVFSKYTTALLHPLWWSSRAADRLCCVMLPRFWLIWTTFTTRNFSKIQLRWDPSTWITHVSSAGRN